MSKIVSIAQSQIGTKEQPSGTNKTKYGKWFGLDGVAWCGIFVSWCYDQAGKPLGRIGFLNGFAGCQTAAAHFKKKGKITTSPVAGDIVFYDWNGDGRYDHTGIFVNWTSKDTFRAVEGNTAIGNDSNGGEVMERERNKKVAIFVHP